LADPANTGSIALSALARYDTFSTRLSLHNNRRIRSGVTVVMRNCIDPEFGDGYTLFGNLDPSEFYGLTDIASRIIQTWGKSCMHYQVASPFSELWHDVFLGKPLDPEQPSVELVLMTMAAVRHVRTAKPAQNGTLPTWAKRISLYGPNYSVKLARNKNAGGAITAAAFAPPVRGKPADQNKSGENLPEEGCLLKHDTGRSQTIKFIPRPGITPRDSPKKQPQQQTKESIPQLTSLLQPLPGLEKLVYLSSLTPTPKAWIAAHPVQYSVLFDDGETKQAELAHVPLHELALTALRRRGPWVSRPRSQQVSTQIIVEAGVSNIFDACLTGRFGAENAILQGVDLKYLPQLKSVTARIINAWERILAYHELPSHFADMKVRNLEADDIKNEKTRLVLMVAAALIDVTQFSGARSPTPIWAQRAIQHYGPTFTKKFMAGEPLPNTDIAEWATHPSLTRSLRRELLNNSNTLQQAILSTLRAFDGYTPENLRSVGWSSEKVETIFTPAVRSYLARRSRSQDPATVATNIKTLMEEELTLENIATQLQISPAVAEKTFSKSDLRETAVKAGYAEPMNRLRKVLGLIRELTNDFGLHYRLACELASHYPKQARDRAKLIQAERPNRPEGTSSLLWDWAVALYPNPADQRRYGSIRSARAHFALLKALNDRSLDAGVPGSDGAIIQEIRDNTMAPEAILFPDVPDDAITMVAVLASKASLKDREKQLLLEYFGDAHNTPIPPYIQGMIDRLREAARSSDT
jgi:hypothetical protein